MEYILRYLIFLKILKNLILQKNLIKLKIKKNKKWTLTKKEIIKKNNKIVVTNTDKT